MTRFLTVALVGVLALCPRPAGAATIDLGHPTVAPFFADNIGVLDDRSVVIDALTNFSITSAGIRFDPLTGGATQIFVDIFQSNLNASFSNSGALHGTLLATASVAIVDVGLAFYDVPVAFSFAAGARYDIAFRANGPNGWGNPLLNNMELYFYNFGSPDGPYSVGGLLSVVDGACHGTAPAADPCSNYNNGAMPHVRLNATATAVPEPATRFCWGRSRRRRAIAPPARSTLAGHGGIPPLLLELRDAQRRLEVLWLGPSVEPGGVVQNQARGDDAAGHGGLGADVDEVSGDQLTRAVPEDRDVASDDIAPHLGRLRDDERAVAPHRSLHSPLEREVIGRAKLTFDGERLLESGHSTVASVRQVRPVPRVRQVQGTS